MHGIHRRHTVATVALVVSLASTAQAAFALPTAPPSGDPVARLDTATQEVIELEDRIEALQAERVAIDTRLEVVDGRIGAQLVELERARERLRLAREAYTERMVSIYKRGTADPLAILLQSESLQDFIARSAFLGQIVAEDRRLWEAAGSAAADARYQTQVLEDLQAQERELKDINESRQRTLERSLQRQKELVAQLSKEAEAYLVQYRAKAARTRQEWIDSSLPMDTEFRFTHATVEPYLDRTFLVPTHQPLRYRSTADSFLAVCSWYGNEFHGRRTASGQTFNENDFTAAHKSLAFGTRLALTRGDKGIIVVITDRGPFVSGRDLDLSKAAAQALGFSGVAQVEAEFVEPLPSS